MCLFALFMILPPLFYREEVLDSQGKVFMTCHAGKRTDNMPEKGRIIACRIQEHMLS